MDNYPYCPDRALEPADAIGGEMVREGKIEASLDEWMAIGHLPGGHDDGTVNDALLDEWPECLARCKRPMKWATARR